MKLKTLLLFFVLTAGSSLFAHAQKPVTLMGKVPEYSGYHIDFYGFADAISEEKQLLTSLKINSDGTFSTSFPLSEITYIFAEFDAYQASLFLVPGEQYELIFPPRKPVSSSQKRNPFFEADEITFLLKNSDAQELNRQIGQFELAYLKEESRYFNQIYHQHSKAAVDSLKSNLHQQFPETDNSYFEHYKFYRTAFAEFALHQGQPAEFVRRYFIDRKPDLSVPPCKQLFQQLFTNYFEFEASKIHSTDFKRLVAQADLGGIENYLITKNGWNSFLSRLVILQSINDAYFQGQFPQRSLFRLLDKITESQWSQENKAIARRLKDKLSYLQQGSEAPNFSMTDFSGEKHQLSDFTGKYVYLNFTRVSNPICRQHLDQLKESASQFEQKLHILNLILPEEADKQELILQQNWAGNFYVVDEKVADTYRVNNFPLAYLIDKNGRLALSPAPNPLDGFEQHFLNLLKQNRINELRNQSK